MQADSSFSDYVEHPRFGRGPRFTGLNPQSGEPLVHLSWRSPEALIPNTAVAADPNRQKDYGFKWSHYFDAKRVCIDCDRPFIFFAEEQKHWYEDLRFGLDSDCVRCVDCRKADQQASRQIENYRKLSAERNLNDNQRIALAECIVALVQKQIFGTKSLQAARAALNAVGIDSPIRRTSTFAELDSESRDLINALG